MNSKEGSFLSALISTFHPTEEARFFRFFSSSIRENLPTQRPLEKKDWEETFGANGWLEPIHYSWFTPFFKSLSKPTQSIYLGLFKGEQKEKLTEELHQTPSSLSPVLVPYVSHQFKTQFIPEDLLLTWELPPSELNALLHLSKPQLVHLIGLLGIHDLAAELRLVVDKSILGKIYAALSQEQLHFLHYCLKQPIKWTPPRLHIQKWSGEKTTLLKIVHEKGLMRFGKAISMEHPSLQWHLCHRLDTGRGNFVMNCFAGKQDPAMISVFKRQVVHLVKRYKP